MNECICQLCQQDVVLYQTRFAIILQQGNTASSNKAKLSALHGNVIRRQMMFWTVLTRNQATQREVVKGQQYNHKF